MTVLLVTYDLKKPGQNYDEFYKVIKTHPWAKLSESSYAIVTDEAPKVIYAKLYSHIDGGDQLFIMTLANSWWGRASDQTPEVMTWLKKYLP
jgi:hypothetical protein